jgi:hypothetical protein
MFWDLEESSEKQSRHRTQLHERVEVTPHGSRMHLFEHVSPGGTARLEQYASPAVVRASGKERVGCRSRIAKARMEASMRCRAYLATCVHCKTSRTIGRDGCIHAHSIGPSLCRRERAAYEESEAYATHGWQCPGSCMYYGPRSCEEDEDEV